VCWFNLTSVKYACARMLKHLQVAGNTHLVGTGMSKDLPVSLPADFHPHITFPHGGQQVATSVW
jgi:hypothetical protein